MKTVIAALSLLASSACFATTTWVRCDSCDASVAQSYAIASGYFGAVVIYNLPAGNAFRFFNETQVGGGSECRPNSIDPGVSKSQNRSSGCSVVVATPKPIQSYDLLLKNALVDFYNATDGSLWAKAQFSAEAILPGAGPVTGADGGSAYDFVHNAIYRAQMVAQVRAAARSLTQWVAWRNLVEAISTCGVQLLGFDSDQFKAKILYPDGSQTILMFDKDMDVVSRQSLSGEGLAVVTAGTAEFLQHA